MLITVHLIFFIKNEVGLQFVFKYPQNTILRWLELIKELGKVDLNH